MLTDDLEVLLTWTYFLLTVHERYQSSHFTTTLLNTFLISGGNSQHCYENDSADMNFLEALIIYISNKTTGCIFSSVTQTGGCNLE